jgi:hypothetical protein
MIVIPSDISAAFTAVLVKRAIPASLHAEYRKWLRYFLDYCDKHAVPDSRSEQVRLFNEKLKEKKQTSTQQTQAAHAVSLYFESLRRANRSVSSPPSEMSLAAGQNVGTRRSARFSAIGYTQVSNSPAWDEVIASLASATVVDHG